MIEQTIYGLEHNLEQIVNKDLFKILKSIDRMVKSDNPRAILNKHEKDYNKMSNVKKSITLQEGANDPFFTAPDDGDITRGGKKK